MIFHIFRDAYHLYQGGYVNLKYVTGRTARFIVDEIDVRVETTLSGLKFHCDCEAHMKRMAQDKLCKRIISLFPFIKHRNKKIKNLKVELGYKLYDSLGVWLESAEDKVLTFDVQGRKLILETIPTGTRFRREEERINALYDVDEIAVIFYMYSKKGKVKKKVIK